LGKPGWQLAVSGMSANPDDPAATMCHLACFKENIYTVFRYSPRIKRRGQGIGPVDETMQLATALAHLVASSGSEAASR